MTPARLLCLAEIGGVVTFVTAVYALGHHQGENAVQGRWDASKALFVEAQAELMSSHAKDIEKLRLAQESANIKISEEHQKVINEIATKNTAALAAVRVAGGLRIPRTVCSAVEPVTEPASDGRYNEDIAATVKLPDSITSRLFSEARRADEVVEQARACQSWIHRQGFYNVHPPVP